MGTQAGATCGAGAPSGRGEGALGGLVAHGGGAAEAVAALRGGIVHHLPQWTVGVAHCPASASSASARSCWRSRCRSISLDHFSCSCQSGPEISGKGSSGNRASTRARISAARRQFTTGVSPLVVSNKAWTEAATMVRHSGRLVLLIALLQVGLVMTGSGGCHSPAPSEPARLERSPAPFCTL
jgi:hypothetical protein